MSKDLARENAELRRQLAEARADAERLAEALTNCYEQLHDQQAMSDDSGDAEYESALAAHRAETKGETT